MTTHYADALEVQSAARNDIAVLTERLYRLYDDGLTVAEPEVQTVLARIQIANIVMAFPAASLGSCSIDGTPLSARGRGDQGVWICCNGDPEHCWQNSAL